MVRLLVVDEDVWMCDFLWDFFTPKNYEVFTALNKVMALNLVKEVKPQVVLLDLSMNSLGGIEILKAIRDIAADIGIVTIAHAEDALLARDSLRMGAFDCITKPFDLDYLEGVVSVLTALRWPRIIP
jgi:DNA-binding NtrC family response regulator